ncbi:hypothetical protein SAMN00777080_0446 [Aquiflexum balticum DSM 16537]|uniref:Uncharacterized protein n=1 Tax=Aquiflexum balticum DSM 16537 TaxID=758820 RepID=A0A1W2GZU8_9BACT|nr:hypothetical protein SAMN00777080_0446 [Aquiflexum balticum DSM 16537]
MGIDFTHSAVAQLTTHSFIASFSIFKLEMEVSGDTHFGYNVHFQKHLSVSISEICS